MLTKFVILLYSVSIIKAYEFEMNVKGKFTRANNYALLDVQLDILRTGKSTIQSQCSKIFADRDIQFNETKLSYFNDDFKIATLAQQDFFLPYHVQYRFPDKFYTYKVKVNSIEAKRISCIIIYNQAYDDKILRIYLLALPADPTRSFYFRVDDPDKTFHVFAYPVLYMGKVVMHAIYYNDKNEKFYTNIVPSFLNFPDVYKYNSVQEQLYEELKIQFRAKNKLYAVDMNQSFDDIRPHRYIYKVIDQQTKKIETKIFILFEQNDGINEYFFKDRLLFFHDEIQRKLNQLVYEKDIPFHIDAFTFQNFENLTHTSLQKVKSLPVQKVDVQQYKSFNFPSHLQILINQNLKSTRTDDLKILAFVDQTGEEHRVAAFIKPFQDQKLQVDYFPICFIYDEVDQVIRVANQTILYDFADENYDQDQGDNLQIRKRQLYNFKNDKFIYKLKKKPDKLMIRVSCVAQESPYNTKIIFVQIQKNDKMCVVAICKEKHDFIVQKQEIVQKRNSKNELKNFLTIDIQPDLSNVL